MPCARKSKCVQTQCPKGKNNSREANHLSSRTCVHVQTGRAAKNLNQEAVWNASQWRCREDGGPILHGLIVRPFHHCSGAGNDRVIKSVFCVDTERGIRPHQLLNQIEQFRAFVEINLGKILLTQAMPSFASI